MPYLKPTILIKMRQMLTIIILLVTILSLYGLGNCKLTVSELIRYYMWNYRYKHHIVMKFSNLEKRIIYIMNNENKLRAIYIRKGYDALVETIIIKSR